MNTYDCNEGAEGTEVLRSHYGLMLGLQRPWRVETVKLDVVGKRLELGLEWEREGASQDCPECGRACHLHDHAPERQWRHLDAMGFVTTLRARVPRIKCPEHGVKSAAIPWALPHGRFTLAFEAMVIEVVKACASVHAACELLNLEWKHVHAIMERAVQRGMGRRRVEGLKSVGFDEKSFKRGQSFISWRENRGHPLKLSINPPLQWVSMISRRSRPAERRRGLCVLAKVFRLNGCRRKPKEIRLDDERTLVLDPS